MDGEKTLPTGNDLEREKNRARCRAYYAAHREEKKQYAAAHKAEIRAKSARYRARHPAKVTRYHRTYYAQRRETLLLQQRQARARHSAASRLAAAARWKIYREKNRDKERARHAAYHRTHAAQRRLAQKLYAARHPEMRQALRSRRRALKKQAPINDLTAAQWLEIQAAYDHRCAYCGRRSKGHLTQDHILPLSKGGPHTTSNVIPACRVCNSHKYNNAPPSPVQPLLLTLAPPRKQRGSDAGTCH